MAIQSVNFPHTCDSSNQQDLFQFYCFSFFLFDDGSGWFGPAVMSSKRFTLARLFEKHYNEFSLSPVWSMNQ